jgi:MarR family transcriptional regulator, negative regulator of the multidrug operon emrRAB
MNGENRLSAIDKSTPAMLQALPDLPMRETVLIRLLRLCFAGMGDFFAAEFRKIGLSENSFHVLCLLVANEDGQASPSDLSDLVGTSRANMTRILSTLVDEGLATRQIVELDGRRHMIQITAAGRRAAMEAVPRLVRPLQQAFSGLDAGELFQLDALLRKCVKSFNDNALPFGLLPRRESSNLRAAGEGEHRLRKAKRKAR